MYMKAIILLQRTQSPQRDTIQVIGIPTIGVGALQREGETLYWIGIEVYSQARNNP